MPRTILVMGTGRSGTSAVAGIMHKLGCPMGRIFVAADNNNRYGTYEDTEFRSINLIVAYQDWLLQNSITDGYNKLILARNERHDIWGVKDPDLVHTAHHILPLVDEAKIIVCERESGEVIASYERAYDVSPDEAADWFERTGRALERQLEQAQGVPILVVNFENLLDDPAGQVERIADFAFDGLDMDISLGDAIAHVRPENKRLFVYIGVLTGGQIRAELDAALISMSHDGRYETEIDFSWGRPIPDNRNKIKQKALVAGADYLLMIDSDAWPLRNLLDLVEYDLDVVAFPCPIWRPGVPEPPVVMNLTPLDGKRNIDLGGTEPFEIMRGGFSAVMIARRVLEAMPPFAYRFDENGRNTGDEDIMFCDAAREAGFKIWTSPQHICDHNKPLWLLKVVNEFARVSVT